MLPFSLGLAKRPVACGAAPTEKRPVPGDSDSGGDEDENTFFGGSAAEGTVDDAGGGCSVLVAGGAAAGGFANSPRAEEEEGPFVNIPPKAEEEGAVDPKMDDPGPAETALASSFALGSDDEPS